MRHALIAAMFAVFAVGSAAAQGPPASVNSLAPGRGFAPPASVNSLGPNGFSNLPVLLGNPAFPTGGFHIGGGHRRHPGFWGVGAVFVPYYVPVTPAYDVPEQGEAEPGMIDRRAGASYVTAPVPEDESRYGVHYLDRPEQTAPAQSAPASPRAPVATTEATSSIFDSQPRTVLIFKDGHRLEITNYAIQGTTLFNLSGKGPRRIDTAELDVTATMKENDDRGLEFRLP